MIIKWMALLGLILFIHLWFKESYVCLPIRGGPPFCYWRSDGLWIYHMIPSFTLQTVFSAVSAKSFLKSNFGKGKCNE